MNKTVVCQCLVFDFENSKSFYQNSTKTSQFCSWLSTFNENIECNVIECKSRVIQVLHKVKVLHKTFSERDQKSH